MGCTDQWKKFISQFKMFKEIIMNNSKYKFKLLIWNGFTNFESVSLLQFNTNRYNLLVAINTIFCLKISTVGLLKSMNENLHVIVNVWRANSITDKINIIEKKR